MARQKGQSMVEFVLAVPILMLLFFGIFYSALIYAEYLQYNNAARDVARDIAVQANEENRTQLRNDLNNQVPSVVSRYVRSITHLNLYKGNFTVGLEGEGEDGKHTEVHVIINFEKQSVDSLVPAFARGIFPDSLPKIEYFMRLEEDKKDTEEGQEDPANPTNPAESPEGEG